MRVLLFVGVLLLGVSLGYFLLGVTSTETYKLEEKSSNIVYVEKTIPDFFADVITKYDRAETTLSSGEIIFSYELHDLNNDNVSELFVCKENGGQGMYGPTCDMKIYKQNNSGGYEYIYQAFVETFPTVSTEMYNGFKVLYQDLGFETEYRCEIINDLYSCKP
jgi:hypothetical protein